MMKVRGLVLNRIGCGISFALLCAAFVASPALADQMTEDSGASSTKLSKMTGEMSVAAGKSPIDEEPAHSMSAAERAAERAAGVLRQYAPKSTGRITSLSTLDHAGRDSKVMTPQLAQNNSSTRGYNSWRKTSRGAASRTRNVLPLHATPTRGSSKTVVTVAKPAPKAAPAKPAVTIAKPAPKTAPVKPAVTIAKPAPKAAPAKPAVTIAKPAPKAAPAKPAVTIAKPAPKAAPAKPAVTIAKPAPKAAPAKPAVTIAKPAPKAAPAKPTVTAMKAKATPAPKASPRSVARKAPIVKTPTIKATAATPSKARLAATPAKTVKTATVKPDSLPKKQVVAAPATSSASPKTATQSSSAGPTNFRSWRARIFSSSAKASVTKTTAKTDIAAAAPTKPAPVKTIAKPAATTAKPIQTAASTTTTPASNAIVMKTSAAKTSISSPAPIVVAGSHGATKLGKTMTPTATENPAAKGSLIARGSGNGASNIMRVLTGKSIMIDLAKDAKRVAVADPQTAQVLIITPKQIMVNGLAKGETSIIIWDRAGNYTMSSVVVGDELADQVMLEVTVAEINRSAMERHGVDYRNFGGQFQQITQFGGAAPTSGSYPPSQSDPPLPLSLDGGISWAVIDAKNDIALVFKQMQDDALGRILAEPKLLARSGKEASFLSGGEIPIVVASNDDTSIEFKEFGVSIDFMPTVREDGTIDLKLATEVSEPDYAGGVQLFGFTVPAFITRRTHTNVSLLDGQSLIVAGLIKESKQELESKMPFMGDIPVLGYFFRRTEYTDDVLELIMVVQPRLVRPIASGTRVALPTDRGPLTRQEVRTGPVEEKVVRPRPY